MNEATAIITGFLPLWKCSHEIEIVEDHFDDDRSKMNPSSSIDLFKISQPLTNGPPAYLYWNEKKF